MKFTLKAASKTFLLQAYCKEPFIASFLADGLFSNEFLCLFEVFFSGGVPLTPLGRPLALSKAPRFVFECTFFTPGHHFGHFWASWGALGTPVDIFA